MRMTWGIHSEHWPLLKVAAKDKYKREEKMNKKTDSAEYIHLGQLQM